MIIVALSLLSFFGYAITNKKPFIYKLETKLDQKIQAIKIFVIPYLAFFPYVLLAYILLKGDLRTAFALSTLICNISATTFWHFFPNGVTRPPIPKNDVFSRIINFIYEHDGDTNGFPSGHVFSSAIASHYFILQYPQLMWFFLINWGLIALSIIFTKQHYLVDILGGIIFAVASISLSNLLFGYIL